MVSLALLEVFNDLYFLTFIRNLESQGATSVIRFKVKPHLVTGAYHEVWGGGSRQAEGRAE